MILAFIGLGSVNVFSQPIETIEARQDLYFVGDRTYSCFYITDAGVIGIAPVNSTHAEATLKAVQEVTDQPVAHVFYSHNHRDHISGGEVFKEEGATIISQAEAARHIIPNPEVVTPDITWAGGQTTFTLGVKRWSCTSMVVTTEMG